MRRNPPRPAGRTTRPLPNRFAPRPRRRPPSALASSGEPAPTRASPRPTPDPAHRPSRDSAPSAHAAAPRSAESRSARHQKSAGRHRPASVPEHYALRGRKSAKPSPSQDSTAAPVAAASSRETLRSICPSPTSRKRNDSASVYRPARLDLVPPKAQRGDGLRDRRPVAESHKSEAEMTGAPSSAQKGRPSPHAHDGRLRKKTGSSRSSWSGSYPSTPRSACAPRCRP